MKITAMSKCSSSPADWQKFSQNCYTWPEEEELHPFVWQDETLLQFFWCWPQTSRTNVTVVVRAWKSAIVSYNHLYRARHLFCLTYHSVLTRLPNYFHLIISFVSILIYCQSLFMWFPDFFWSCLGLSSYKQPRLKAAVCFSGEIYLVQQ